MVLILELIHDSRCSDLIDLFYILRLVCGYVVATLAEKNWGNVSNIYHVQEVKACIGARTA